MFPKDKIDPVIIANSDFTNLHLNSQDVLKNPFLIGFFQPYYINCFAIVKGSILFLSIFFVSSI